MSTHVGTETADFDVVSQQIRKIGNLVVLPGEKLLLIIEARTPSEIRPHF